MARQGGPELSERQRAYLLAIFTVDQELEAEMRNLPYRPFQSRPKASEWRWLEYSEPMPEIDKPASRLYAAIKKAAPIDQGTGATFAALADRGLVEVDWREYNVHGQRTPYIRMTPAGRRLVRSWTGQKAHKAPPAGTQREWHWRALAKAYAAGNEGLVGEYGEYAHSGWNTWRRLRDYKAGALVEEHGLRPPFDHRLRITSAGRRLYAREWALPRDVPRRRGARASHCRRGSGPVTEERAPTCSLCGSSADVARRWIDTRGNPFLGGKWSSGLLCAACAARQDTPPAELGDPEHLAAAALAELERQIEAGEQSLMAGSQQPPQSQGLWVRYGLERPAYEGLDDLGEPCELCGYGTRPTGPLDWELVECQWCRARVRVHVQCDERVQQAFPQVDCPRCGRVWPDWWKLGAGAGEDRR